jgi:glucose-1-phosphate thymidylyltransferase
MTAEPKKGMKGHRNSAGKASPRGSLATHESGLVALVLAGGAGSRMGTTGAQIPKVYLPVGIEPVINRPVSRTLSIKDLVKIFILTRRAHPSLPGVDLWQWAKSWKEVWYPNEPRIEILCEEELKQPSLEERGAVVAIAQAVQWLAKSPNCPSYVLILAGDNFIDSDIGPLLRASHDYKDEIILATRSISNRAMARGRFGVIEVNYKDATSSPVITYEEKPQEPKSSDVSIGLYIFPFRHLTRVNDYLKHVSQQRSPTRRKELAGAPGYFLEWLVREEVPVRAVRFDKGIWVDVGTPSSFLTSIVQLSSELIERPRCARDLDVLGSTKNLNDRYYFACQRIEVLRDAGAKVISLFFQGDDPVATLNANAADEKSVISVSKLRSKNKEVNDKFWSILEKDEEGVFSTTRGLRCLDSPVLISGGVFLIDRASAASYQRGTALLPLFMRDFSAPVDAGRLTTAAGRMDKLDLLDVCVSEHSEGMIFFGASATSETTRILICSPPEWRYLTRACRIIQ